ncbi:chemotaxis protein CheW [Thiopseudomonas alkaliphila]|uniref:Chemotaxis protein CheW n=1 Tax=Thiopseudomonas alkaliphila TaxID=1697053 RepID=A0AAW7DT78_9GAMM|nr:chemotaxis protein CheW [Thiopseudomonas alkaliphila]MDM1696796.1 chemotaxis protein CheW [Thiopseudomonas alkaliphila]
MANTSTQFSKQPFQQLLELAALCQTHSSYLPAQRDAAHSWSGVGFRLGSHRYVVPFDEVSEVLYELSYTMIPRVKSWIKGVANVRGRLLPIIDLNALLDAPFTTPSKVRRVIVIEHDDIFAGFLVDEVYGMQHFLIASYQEIADTVSTKAQPYIHGAFVNEHTWQVFSLEQLIQSPDFFAVIA